MERQRPDTTSNEIELYIRTYYSVLRSTGAVRVRAFEESHLYSNSSLHLGARDTQPDVSAFGYAASRLPQCMVDVRRLVLGQSEEQFESYGYDVHNWHRVRSPGRRRPLRFDARETLAAFIRSSSDIDDLVPIVTAYQIEWNKIHALLASSARGGELSQTATELDADTLQELVREILDLDAGAAAKLREALGERFGDAVASMSALRLDLRMQLLAASFSQYQRAAQRWWSNIEPIYLRDDKPRRRPVYFVSSNTHSLANLIGGYARNHREALLETARREASAELVAQLEDGLAKNPENAANLLYFVLRQHIQAEQGAIDEVQAWDAESGICNVPDQGHVEVSAQVIELAKIRPDRCDPRIHVDGIETLAASDAVILNIDYPLGMAAYQLLSRVGQGSGPLLGVYVMGKAATLNGRVGDVMISNVVHDEHSYNTYLFKNAFRADDVWPYLQYGTVLDNQKALTARSAFLQNRQYMGVFYREGFTVLEMEAGPYMSAIFELADPRRHPNDEIVRLGERITFDAGILHYASDTPYSRRQELLSKSLSYFGMDSTYACAVAITRRIFQLELERLQS